MIAGISGYVQKEAKHRLCADMVITLREALLAYHGQTGYYPPGTHDQDAWPAITALLAERVSASLLREWPVPLSGDSATIADYVDPWGQRFRFVTADNGSVLRREDVELDQGVPIFESAGPDRDFGDSRISAREDNVSSDIAALIAASGG